MAALFYLQAFLILAAAAAFAGLLLALLRAPLDDGAISPDLPGGHQRARPCEHHNNKHVLHAQLASGEQRGEGFEGGVVSSFHGSKF